MQLQQSTDHLAKVTGIRVEKRRVMKRLDMPLHLRQMAADGFRKSCKAIRRIKEGIDGICEVCREPIPEARQKAMNFMATTCVTCQGAAEYSSV